MSRKFLAQASVMSLALILAGCGGDDDSSPLAGTGDNGGGTTEQGGTDADNGTDTENEISLALGNGSDDSFQEAQIGVTTKSLSPGGESILTVTAVDQANGNSLAAGETVSINFSSPCIGSGESIINTPVMTDSGVAEARYEAAGCAGEDMVTATTDSGETAQVLLDIAPATADQIASNPPVPASISPNRNSNSARSSVSVVTFNVVDSNGAAVRGVDVDFRLSYSALANNSVKTVSLNPKTATSGPGGQVTTRVTAGEQNTVVRVVASVGSSNIETTSPPIAINSFVPDQDSFSMSLDTFMPNAQYHNNEIVNVTINAADRFNNVIRGGTVVSFITSGGAIKGDCILSEMGTCTVQWISTDPRPASGRVSILARTVGDESFKDIGVSNDQFDDGEFSSTPPIFLEKGEPYLDYIEAGDSQDEFIGTGGSGKFDEGKDLFFDYNGDGIYNGPDGTYDGSGCLDDSANCTEGPVAVWDRARIVMASDQGVSVDLNSGGGNEYCATISAKTQGGVKVPPPSRTTVAFSIEDGKISSSTSSFDLTNGYVSDDKVTYCVSAGQDDESTTTPILTVSVTPPAPYGGSPIEDVITIL